MSPRKRQKPPPSAAVGEPGVEWAPQPLPPDLPVDRKVVVLGDVRPTGIMVADEPASPEIAIWVKAESGEPWGTFIAPPGARAATLVQALAGANVPGQVVRQKLPGRLIVFDAALAEEIRTALGRPEVTIEVAERWEPFEQLFADLLAMVGTATGPLVAPLELKPETMALLCEVGARLWRLQPWQFAYEDPLIELTPRVAEAKPLYASILGANGKVFGVSFYDDPQDFVHDEELGTELGEDEEDESEEAEAEAAALLAATRGRVVLFSFDPKEELPAEYVDRFTKAGWPRRFEVVPVFITRGGSPPGAPLSEDEARRIALAAGAVVEFCERHEDAIGDEAFPIQDTVAVRHAGQTIEVEATMPPSVELTSASPSIYRFKVTLAGGRGVWRRIDVRSDQTLVDLHQAIQQAFGWDNDHLYSFFLSGRAWDTESEFTHPANARESGAASARVRLARLRLRPKQRLLYIFDFGDEWRHRVVLEKTDLKPDGGDYPRIVESHGTPPPQYPDWGEEGEEQDAPQ